MPIRVALISRRALIRGLVAAWLRTQTGNDIVLEAPCLDGTSNLADATLLIFDARDCGDFTVLEALRGRALGIRVLIITPGQGDYVLQRGSAVATGLVHEMDGLEVLSAAIAAVAAGGVYHSAAVVQRQGALPLRALTARELRVLEHACAGTSDDETAKLVGCSSATIETHRRNVMRKLGARDWMELVILGIRLGIVSVESIPIGSLRRRSSSRRKQL